ncbi:uncharacterized protein F13E9.13, mitochondrial-like [Homarus americanus]|uniref:BtpA family-like protein n=1 Tax=Homarus americanus TaxID=6706 RepID=A0A8J5N409_HOMAM|nr:uncharacterized protein F13E9.13, mitochondrial-like [Homarus americanus]XP_042214214.1 uncharacterized protein F13E9.13, mitochondrial-like [Homarus americanus]XP_042214215.1 uncharacterized protein F13E9.13, mitochondrial-like [Homarus americanus]XP_042214216.1 uncharacterized protein F13E9.13, mitochondrial-like [Homarus americanus]XP_042214217.1 uncharacterized protein F13E9.13, mitochondrial-like [Homarus americanus]XP_042214218.1 uncharacterized protein F13E9.13, mitochondrial-like [H
MALSRFTRVFHRPRSAVIGMIHVKALPGTPLHRHRLEKLVEMARSEAQIYAEAGVDGILVENMFDLPYLKGSVLGPEVVACMTRVCHEVRSVTPKKIPCGVQILAGGNQEALAVSKACGLEFIRAECFVFSHVADEGLMDGCAGPLLRYRRAIDADDVLVFTDIKKKHSAHSITDDVSVVEMAEAARFFLADGVILTGSATGQEADHQQLHDVRSVDLPVLVGSGVTKENVHKFINANGFIVGSHFKRDGKWTGELEYHRVKAFTDLVKSLRRD